MGHKLINFLKTILLDVRYQLSGLPLFKKSRMDYNECPDVQTYVQDVKYKTLNKAMFIAQI